MNIDTSEIASSSRAVAVTFSRPPMEGTVGDGEEVRVQGTAQRVEGGVRLSGHLDTHVSVSCARCSKVFPIPVETDFALTYRSRPTRPPSPAEILLTAEECLEAALDERGRIDLLDLAREQIYLAVPLKPICAAGCRGLCSRCGNDLNVRACPCSVPPRDSRWDGLADLKLQRSTDH